MRSPSREFRTVDILRRVAVIAPENVKLVNHPVKHPVAVFNPAMFLEGEVVVILARVVLGYYKYVSAIAEIRLGLNEVLEGRLPKEVKARLVINPGHWFDIWGAEDPRSTVIEGSRYVVYTGRTMNYFSGTHEKTLPIIARETQKGEWVKVGVVRHQGRGGVVSDKDAFIVKTSNEYILFHRPHYGGRDFRTVVSRLRSLEGEVIVEGTRELLRPERFEEKIGWGTPPVEVGAGDYLLILHGVDRFLTAYRAFAALLRIGGGQVEVTGISRAYIMEPREPYEVYGDRPLTIFPCGAVRVDNSVLIAYGAADQVIGLGVADLSDILDLVASVPG